MSVINTNVKSLISQNAMVKNNRDLSTAMQQLSTGKRINSAKDDAAGLAISSRMTAQVRGLDAAVRNANDSISLLQTAEGALIEVTNMLQRMRELSIQAANDTNTADDRRFLDLEFQQLKEEINRIAKNTEWNGMGILDRSADAGNGAGKFEFQVGANANQLISITLKDFTIESAVIGSPGGPVTTQSTGTVSKSTVSPASAEVPARAQKSVVSLAGTYAAGDVIDLKVQLPGEAQPRSIPPYTVTAADVAATPVVQSIATNILGITGIDNTLGVTIQKNANNELELTGPSGVAFTPTITRTPVGTTTSGTVAVGTESVVNGRETNTVTLAGTFVAGDVLTFGNGVDTYSYTVTSNDTASVTTLANNIRAGMSGYFPDTLVDASNGVLTFTKTTVGENLNLTSSIVYKNDTTAVTTPTTAVAYQAAVAGPATQESQIVLGQQFFKDDVINVSIGNQSYSYTVTEDDEKAATPSNSVVAGLTLQILTNPPSGIQVSNAGSTISLTGNTVNDVFTLNVAQVKTNRTTETPEVIAREAGSLNMIKDSDILTRINADSSIISLDDAIFTINEARAEMGAVMNRLTYAGDNLMNVSQNTTESRSRILDADYAKSSSELARTQIISQAATAMLAQANQSPQSVLQLLQG